MRLDVFLVERGFFDSRQKAKEAIQSHQIKINNTCITKPSFEVQDTLDSNIESKIQLLQKGYVSRSALKLKGFLEEIDFCFNAKHYKNAIDVGAARGGFSEVLLEYGVGHICCVDVGNNQLHPKLRLDSRIEVFEDCDIREFSKQNLRFDLLVCDVSFIGIEKIFDVLERLSPEMILLFKPQFEVGKDTARNKKGVVTDTRKIQEALSRFVEYVHNHKCEIICIKPAVIRGKEGNEEFFIYLKK